MQNLEEQLNDLIAQADRVAADLNRELYLIDRADAAITYLRSVREQTAVQVAALLDNRGRNAGAISARTVSDTGKRANGNGFGIYDPNWPQ